MVFYSGTCRSKISRQRVINGITVVQMDLCCSHQFRNLPLVVPGDVGEAAVIVLFDSGTPASKISGERVTNDIIVVIMLESPVS